MDVGRASNPLATPCDRSIDLKELVVDELALGPVRSVIGVRMRTRTSNRLCTTFVGAGWVAGDLG